MFEKLEIIKVKQEMPEDIAAYSIRQWNEAIIFINGSREPAEQGAAENLMELEIKRQSKKTKNTVLKSNGEILLNVKRLHEYV